MKNTTNNTTNNTIDNNVNINKPMSIILEEQKKILVDAINKIELHPVLLEMIVKEAYYEVRDIAKAQGEREKVEYHNALLAQQSSQKEVQNKPSENAQ